MFAMLLLKSKTRGQRNIAEMMLGPQNDLQLQLLWRDMRVAGAEPSHDSVKSHNVGRTKAARNDPPLTLSPRDHRAFILVVSVAVIRHGTDVVSNKPTTNRACVQASLPAQISHQSRTPRVLQSLVPKSCQSIVGCSVLCLRLPFCHSDRNVTGDFRAQ